MTSILKKTILAAVLGLGALTAAVPAASAASLELSGDDKARKKLSGFFTGQIMKASKGQADGRAVAQLLAQRSAG